ncbi:MAG TPA: SRPBCC family protein [Terriglobales bacterium]|nr:SRPBCC family protein [Terriglobales bacterium]
MSRDGFWSGFGAGVLTGAAAGSAAFLLASGRASSYDSRILRLERSIQIGRPMEEVFAAWSRFEELPRKISALRRVDVNGDRSTWVVEIDGRPFEFEAVISQLVPNQAIGWKSVTGPKHSGRIHFARLGDATLVHVTMNYAPPLGRLGRLLAPITDHLESQIEEALRDFKRSLEETSAANRESENATDAAVDRWGGRPPASAGWDDVRPRRATGTEGMRTMNPPGTPGTHVEDREQVRNPGAVDYTRPPENR